MSEQEQTYDEGRARNLEALLRALAERIRELDRQGRLLEDAGELMRLIGDVRAEHRRIVREAQETDKSTWQPSEWTPPPPPPPDEDENKEP
jgi:hypothetical protein